MFRNVHLRRQAQSRQRWRLPVANDALFRYYHPAFGGGQYLHDLIRGVSGELGSGSGSDTADPSWTGSPPALDFDGADRVRIAEAPLDLSSDFEVMAVVQVKDGSDSFELTTPSVTNLSSEYFVEVDAGDNLSLSAPSNWDPDEWLFHDWVRADWANTDGKAHTLFQAYADASNYILIQKTAANSVQARVRVAATNYDATLTLPFSAGAEVFVGARLSGGTLTLYADTNSDNVLETASVGSIPAYGSLTWTLYFGSDNTPAAHFEGGLNLAILNDGSSADPITERFNAGSGEDIKTWLARVHPTSGKPYAEHLVAYLPKSADGVEVKALSFDGATQLLSDTNEGRYDIASGQYISFGNSTTLDGATAFTMFGEVEMDAPTTVGEIVSRWGSTNAAKQLIVQTSSTNGYLKVYLATDLVGTNAQAYGSTAHSAGDRFQFFIVYDGSGATNADRLKVYLRSYDSSTRQYSAWAQETLTFTGTIPSSLTTPTTAADLRVGQRADGVSGDLKIDDLRIIVGTAHDTTVRDRTYINEANPAHWDHWWPFDGNANDQIGSLNGTVTGATQVNDGRHQIGRFERFVRQGQYYFDGVDDEISLGNWTGLDGATKFAMFFVFRPERIPGAGDMYLARDNDTQRQFAVFHVYSGSVLRVGLGTNLSGGFAYGQTPDLTEDTTYAAWIYYDGSGAANADRLKIALATYDEATGTWSAFTEQTLVFSGTIPSSLITPSTSVTAYFGRRATGGGEHLKGFLDDFRIWIGANTPSTTDLDSLSVYDEFALASPSGVNDPDHWWTFYGDANDKKGTLHGTVSGAIQWYDGRHPEGWDQAGTGSPAEFDRATGSSEATEGTFGFHGKDNPTGDSRLRYSAQAQATVGAWYYLAGRGRSVNVSGSISFEGSGSMAFDTANFAVPVGALPTTVAGVVQAVRALPVVPRVNFANTNSEVYVDDLRAYQLAEPAWATATKAIPSRVVWSESQDASGGPYIYLALQEGEAVEAGVRNSAGTRYEAGGDTTATIGWHTVGLQLDGTTLRAILDTTAEATTATVSGDVTGVDVTTIGAIRLGVAGHGFDANIGTVLLFNRKLTDAERDTIHNWLRAMYYPDLAAA